jgi:hypothetical protein
LKSPGEKVLSSSAFKKPSNNPSEGEEEGEEEGASGVGVGGLH